eukprot:2780633-Alexandrium_andersonii.AAC.1
MATSAGSWSGRVHPRRCRATDQARKGSRSTAAEARRGHARCSNTPEGTRQTSTAGKELMREAEGAGERGK